MVILLIKMAHMLHQISLFVVDCESWLGKTMGDFGPLNVAQER